MGTSFVVVENALWGHETDMESELSEDDIRNWLCIDPGWVGDQGRIRCGSRARTLWRKFRERAAADARRSSFNIGSAQLSINTNRAPPEVNRRLRDADIDPARETGFTDAWFRDWWVVAEITTTGRVDDLEAGAAIGH